MLVSICCSENMLRHIFFTPFSFILRICCTQDMIMLAIRWLTPSKMYWNQIIKEMFISITIFNGGDDYHFPKELINKCLYFFLLRCFELTRCLRRCKTAANASSIEPKSRLRRPISGSGSWLSPFNQNWAWRPRGTRWWKQCTRTFKNKESSVNTYNHDDKNFHNNVIKVDFQKQ